jgi:drug/metabolite transporter (DMT)-like permease
MDEGARAPDAMTLGAFGVAVMLGAGNFLAVRVSNLELPPFWGAGLRFGLAAALFVVIAGALRLPWPRGRQLALTAVYGALSFTVFYALMYWALVRVTAGVATVVLASVPLATLLLATAQGSERLRLRSVTGGLLALGGIAWMTVGLGTAVVPAGALIALLCATLAASQSIIVAKRLAGSHPAMTNAVAMSVGAVLLLALSAVAGERWFLPRETEAALAVVYLVTLGSAGLFVLVLLVVRRWTASATAYMFVLFPVATMALEAVLLGEPVNARTLSGAGLVMVGVWFGALRRRPQPLEPSPSSGTPLAAAVPPAAGPPPSRG